MATALTEDALPVMMQRLDNPGVPGNADVIWEMSHELALSQSPNGLADFTRSDGDWSERRHHVRELLLGSGHVAALVSRHAPAAPEQASDWLGFLGLTVLAAAGQHAVEHRLNAMAFQRWLATGSQLLPAPTVAPAVAPVLAAVGPRPAAELQPVPESRTAPWWPLVVLAVVGIVSSSYYWNKQTTEAKRAALKSVVASTPVAFQEAVLDVLAPEEPTPTSPGTDSDQALALAASAKPVVSPTRGQAEAAPAAPSLEEQLPRPVVDLLPVDTTGLTQQAIPANLVGPDNDRKRGEEPVAAAPGPASERTAGGYSAETALGKRMLTADLSNQSPLPLEQVGFGFGQATLDTRATYQLENIAVQLKIFPRCKLIVYGYAGSGEPNAKALALDRANAVVTELVRLGVRKTCLQAQAHPGTPSDKGDEPNDRHHPTLYVSALK